MLPLQYDLRLSAAKQNNYYCASTRGCEEPGRSDPTAICRDAVAKHNRITVRTTATQIAAPKPDPDAQAEKRRS